MSFAIRGKIGGLGDVFRKLDGVKNALRNRILRAAVGDGMKVVLDAAKAGAPRDSGLLRRSLGRRVKVYRNSGVVVGIVGPRTGFKEAVATKRGRTVTRNATKYAHLVELGTRRMAARPFLGPAWGSSARAAAAAIAERIALEVAKL